MPRSSTRRAVATSAGMPTTIFRKRCDGSKWKPQMLCRCTTSMPMTGRVILLSVRDCAFSSSFSASPNTDRSVAGLNEAHAGT